MSREKRMTRAQIRTVPTPAELEAAARSLYSSLRWIVQQIEAAEEAGLPGGSTWPKVKLWQRKPARKGARATPGTVQAVMAYAQRTTLEDKRRRLGLDLAHAALALVEGTTTEIEAITTAIEHRGFVETDGPVRSADGHIEARDGSCMELRRRVSKCKTPATKWNAAYAYLAHGADVWPSTDSARACRGDRLKLYEAMTRSRD